MPTPVDPTLPTWLANPIAISGQLSYVDGNTIETEEFLLLSENIRHALNDLGIHSLFPVQNTLLPHMLHILHDLKPESQRDICVSAPTGSGKTLAYILPIVQSLQTRVITRLRALIIVPTRDLAHQVKQMFDSVCVYTSLGTAVITGQSPFLFEKKQLVHCDGTHESLWTDIKPKSLIHWCDKNMFPLDQTISDKPQMVDSNEDFSCCSSQIDILISTPGRLMDHIQSTKGFTLKYLRYLVLDEADRLLNQSYQEWLPRLLDALSFNRMDNNLTIQNQLNNPCVQKLLFSATLTRNPEKIASLQLCHPIYFAVEKQKSIINQTNERLERIGDDDTKKQVFSEIETRYVFPIGLHEYMYLCEASEKPLLLLYLMTVKQLGPTICFMNSVENTHRLYRLMQMFGKFIVAEFSSQLTQFERISILERFRKGEVNLLISSDSMARGMDLSNIENVISYDKPKFIKTYLHRVGRTARAGREGCAFTFLEHFELKEFKKLMKKHERDGKIELLPINKENLSVFDQEYESALSKLKISMSLESKPHGSFGSQQQEKKTVVTSNQLVLLELLKTQTFLNLD